MNKLPAILLMGFIGAVLLSSGVSITASAIGLLTVSVTIIILAFIWLQDRKLNCKEKDHD